MPDSIEISTPAGSLTLENDFVMAMTGYEPDFPFLRKVGVKWEMEGDQMLIYDQETHESNIAGIYVAGVVCGGMKTNKFFIENAKDHADKIIGHMVGQTVSPVN